MNSDHKDHGERAERTDSRQKNKPRQRGLYQYQFGTVQAVLTWRLEVVTCV